MSPDEKMNPKPYPPYEEEPMVAAEPVEAYQRTNPAMYRRMLLNPSRSGAETDPLVEEWLCPFTMDELHLRIDEAEAEIEAGEVMSCEEANAEIRRLLPWLL